MIDIGEVFQSNILKHPENLYLLYMTGV